MRSKLDLKRVGEILMPISQIAITTMYLRPYFMEEDDAQVC